jgi:hypothetical protein
LEKKKDSVDDDSEPTFVTCKIRDEALNIDVDPARIYGMTGIYDAKDMTLLWYYKLYRGTNTYNA